MNRLELPVRLPLFLLVLVSGLVACNGTHGSQAPGAPRVNVYLQGEPGAPITHLRLPAAYADKSVGWWESHMPPRPRTDAKPLTERAALLLVLWPGLEPKSKANAPLFDQPRGPWMTVLIHANDPSRIDLDGQMRLNLSSSLGGASGYEPERLIEYPSRHGLRVVGLPPDLVMPRELAWRDQVMVPVKASMDVAPSAVIQCMHETVKDDDAQWKPKLPDGVRRPQAQSDRGSRFQTSPFV